MIMLKKHTLIIIIIFSIVFTTCSLAGDIEALRPKTIPDIPGAPIVEASNGFLSISWQAVKGAIAYEVWAGTITDPNTAIKQGSDVSSLSAAITGLTNDTTYYVWLKAKNSIGTSGFGPAASGTPSAFAVIPSAPQTAPIVVAGSGQLTVSWQVLEGASVYEVWAGTSNDSNAAVKRGSDVSELYTVITELLNDTTYYIWIKAKNSIGTSGFGPNAKGTPLASAGPPSEPLTAPVITAGNERLNISWEAVEGAIVYEVWIGITNIADDAAKKGGDISGLSTIFAGLTNDITYYVWIKAKNSIGTSGFSPAAMGVPSVYAIAPQAPASPSVSIGNSQIIIAWAAVEGATSYEIWLSTENNSVSALKLGEDITTSLSATMDGLSNGVLYFIWLKAKNDYGTSDFSPVTNGKPIADATAVTLIAGNTEIDVNWSDITGADQYEIFYETGDNPPQTASLTINAPTTSVTITGLENGINYNVWIRGKNSSGSGTMSNPASAKPIGNMGLVTLTAGDGQLAANWFMVDGADQYYIYHSITDSIPVNPSQTVSTTTVFIDGLANGTTYYIWVKGINTNGTSNTSTAVSGKPLGIPGLPSLTSGYGQLTVTWTAVAGADEYEVYYGIGTPTILAVTTAETSAIIDGLISGTTYEICLRAKNTIGISNYGPSSNAVPSDSLDPGLYREGVKIGDQNLSSALSWISSNAVNGDNFLIVVGADEAISPTKLKYSGKTVGITLIGSGAERIISLNANGTMFEIGPNVTLTIDDNITLHGKNINTGSLVSIYGYENGHTFDSKLIMNDGAKIKSNNTSGIYVGVGVFLMYGGEISGNSTNGTGGGINCSSSGTVLMYGGKIYGNTAYSGGGVETTSLFTMYGGKISGNIATANDSVGGGGGIRGRVTMHGGVINGNTAIRGGGIHAYFYPPFKKFPLNDGSQNSGIIYGSDVVGFDEDGIPLKNISTNTSSGHVIYSSTGIRNTTADQTDYIDTSTGKGLSVTGNPPFGE